MLILDIATSFLFDINVQMLYSKINMNKLSDYKISQIKKLRENGWSLPEIKNEIKAGYGTVYRYIRGVKISPKHKKEWLGKRGGSIKRKIILEKKAKDKARKLINLLSEKEKIIFLSALYWGEGNKKDFNLVNSDPQLIKVFVKGLKELFKIKTKELKISIRIYEDLDKNKCLKFWSEITEVPVNKIINVDILKGRKNGKLINGMCRVRVKKAGNLLKSMLAIRNRVVECF